MSRTAAASAAKRSDALSVRGDNSEAMRCRKKVSDALSVRRWESEVTADPRALGPCGAAVAAAPTERPAPHQTLAPSSGHRSGPAEGRGPGPPARPNGSVGPGWQAGQP